MTQEATHHEAPKAPPKPVFTDEHPEFPELLYNHETRQTKAAADKKQKEELAKDGFVEEPLPPEQPDALTQAEVAQLESLLAKAAKALAKLGSLSGEKNNAPAADKEKPAAKK